MRRGSIRKSVPVLLGSLACSAVLLSGCGIQAPSASENSIVNVEKRHQANEQRSLLDDALTKSSEIKSYGLKGSISTLANAIDKKVELYGNVVQPDQVNMNETIDGKSYMVIQTKDQTYIRKDGLWSSADRMTKPFNLFHSIQNLDQNVQTIYQLPDDTVISTPTYVLQMDSHVDESKLSSQQGIPQGSTSGVSGSSTSSSNGSIPIRYTFWIGKKDHIIYKMELKWAHSIPSVGNVSEDATFQFFDINSPTKIQLPDGIGDIP